MIALIFRRLLSLNDPRWGAEGGREPDRKKKPTRHSDPADLDELWEQFSDRIKKLLKPEQRGSVPPEGGGPGHKGFEFLGRWGIGLVVIVGLVVWLSTGLFIVDASQRAVVTTFGRYTSSADAGLHWRFPMPIQSHELYNVTGLRTVEIGYRGTAKRNEEALMLTDDENIVNLQFAVQFTLKDAADFAFNNRFVGNDPTGNEGVRLVAESAIREIVGQSKMDFVLYEGREQIAAQAQARMQEILDRYHSGVQISKVNMQNAQPPEEVQAAFDDAIKAVQDRERQINEGQSYANDIVPKAKGTAARLHEEAQGYLQRVIARAEGDASRFKQILVEYSKAPKVMRDRMYLDTMQQIFTSTTKVLTDTKDKSNFLYLPLDRLIQSTTPVSVVSSGASPSSPPVSGTPSPAAVAPIVSSPDIPKLLGEAAAVSVDRSSRVDNARSALRGRDREGH